MKKTIILGIALITFSSVATASIVETTSNGINENYFNSIESVFLIAFSAPVTKLTYHIPNDNLFTIENAFSMYGMIIFGAIL